MTLEALIDALIELQQRYPAASTALVVPRLELEDVRYEQGVVLLGEDDDD